MDNEYIIFVIKNNNIFLEDNKMSSQSLDNILNSAPMAETQSGFYRTIDFYTGGSSRMYSGPLNYGPIPNSPSSSSFKPIGSTGSGFQKGSKNNIRHEVDEYLQERYDFSGHRDTEPHLNYDILEASKKFSEESLGDAHSKTLWEKYTFIKNEDK